MAGSQLGSPSGAGVLRAALRPLAAVGLVILVAALASSGTAGGHSPSLAGLGGLRGARRALLEAAPEAKKAPAAAAKGLAGCLDEGLPGPSADCATMKSQGHCDKPWVASFCQVTCGKCKGNANLAGTDVSKQYGEAVAAAAQRLIAATPKESIPVLQYDYGNSKVRTESRNTTGDPHFSGPLGRSMPWGVQQCTMSLEQIMAMHALLDEALSAPGYQQVIAVMNQQVTIGETEDVADNSIPARVNASVSGSRSYDTIAEGMKAAGIPTDGRPPATAGEVRFFEPGVVTALNWTWPSPPGSVKRLAGFCNYSVAIFGKPGSDDAWGFRVEGHHLSINWDSRIDNGQHLFSLTPMMLGSMPMVVTPVYPSNTSLLDSQWARTRGQRMLARAATDLRAFWRELPSEQRDKAFTRADKYTQQTPFVNPVPAPNVLVGFGNARVSDIEAGAHADVDLAKLDPKEWYSLLGALDLFLGTMHPALATQYLQRLTAARSGKNSNMLVAWAGGNLSDPFSAHYTYLKVNGLQMEYLQSNQFAVTHPGYEATHIHTVFRDTTFKWDFDPLKVHEERDHHSDCFDIAPDYTHTCAQQKAWGKCADDWVKAAAKGAPYGFCAQTCGRCPGHDHN
ncbi:hypothetical protein Rsub_12884 [Raphidocelis subcapitata]|uniref:ShKT domain-containing protein n=1 Tax=Raphidocelis subcapitata TaxID=307507 RepID=A0A2V0PL12_9CHLO|nr:hypothetical protein Rsub_12884 [Raphidocelis subcapitata]|eukprot:GBG00240.1 hypothetical protein Rsub_12884 [Raphidocelis subcapitata]